MSLRVQRSFDNIPVSLRWNVLFSRLPSWPFLFGVGIIVAWLLVFRFTWWPLCVAFDHARGRTIIHSTESWSWPKLITVYLVFVPWFETWVFQACVFTLAKWFKLVPAHPWIVISVSAVLFGSSHWYSLGYILYAIAPGYLLPTAYYFGGCSRRTFWVVAVAHSVFDAICLVL